MTVIKDWFVVKLTINDGDPIHWWEGPLQSCKDTVERQHNLKIVGQTRKAWIETIDGKKVDSNA